MQEDVCKRVMISFGFTSDWPINWCEFVSIFKGAISLFVYFEKIDQRLPAQIPSCMPNLNAH